MASLVTGMKRKYVTLCCNVVMNGRDNCVTNTLYQYSDDETWGDVLDDLLTDKGMELPGKADTVEIKLSPKVNSTEIFHPHINESISVALSFNDNLKCVTFKITPFNNNNGTESETVKKKEKDAFVTLMSNQNACEKRPKLKNKDAARFTAKDKLHNDLVNKMISMKVFFPNSMFDVSIEKHVMTVVNALWYIDGNKDKISSRCRLDDVSFPDQFLESFSGYNDWKKKKKAAPVLSMETLKRHSSLLFDLAGLPFTKSWGGFKDDILNLALSLNQYSSFLEKTNLEQKSRQLLDHPVREVARNAYLCVTETSDGPIEAKYAILDEALSQMEFFEYLCFDEEIHLHTPFKSRFERYMYFENLKLSFPLNLLRYDPGGSIGVTVFLWKVPVQRGLNDLMNDTMRIVSELKPRLPEYHTRLMKREFIKRYCNLHAAQIPKHILRAIYADLTSDASVDQNPTVDARVRQAILAEDSELVLDLRHLNKGRPGDNFEKFFEVLKLKVDDLTAADERRHGIEHFAKYISVRDLIEDVKRELDPDVPVPSESTVLFSFTPKNAYLNTARLYTSKIPLQFKVQTRQLRAAHQDDHFCAAQYKYMRHYAVRYTVTKLLFYCSKVTNLCSNKRKLNFLYMELFFHMDQPVH